MAFTLGTNAQTSDSLEEIVVTAHPLSNEGLAQSITVLSGDELNEKLQGSIGETVAREPGVTSAGYGTAVGRPVIRGLGTTRVKTTQDRIDTLDVSVTSGDHAVAVEPFLAESVEILKGASTLLYGSGAIGGVVNVETGRIASSLTDEDFAGKVELRAADNGDATNVAARFDGKFSDSIYWHVDGFVRDADEFDIPGFGESAALRATGGGEGGETEGILTNSQSESEGGAVGLSFVDEKGFVGFSVSAIESQYGILGEPEELPFLDLEQTRFDVEGQLNNPFSGINSVNFRLGANDYEHAEIIPDEGVVTLFENDAVEARLLFNHQAISGFTGAFGLQFNDRDFSAVGDEAFISPTQTDDIGIFWAVERSYSNFGLELGLRFDDVDYDSSIAGQDRSFSTSSASVGLILPITDSFTFDVLFDFSSRAPSIEELFSNGPHLATGTFEIGDPNLDEEEGFSFTLTANYHTSIFDFSASVYQTEFNDFIYEVANGEINEEFDLPVFLFLQEDASVVGFDAKADITLSSTGNSDLKLSALFDTVDAELDQTQLGNLNIPRIPATRYGLGLAWASDAWNANVKYLRVEDQNDTTEFELPTDSYDDLSIFINRGINLQGTDLELFLHGRNLTDDEQRNHTSIVKDIAPAPGRTFEVGVRLNF